jgi:hypothetical protein
VTSLCARAYRERRCITIIRKARVIPSDLQACEYPVPGRASHDPQLSLADRRATAFEAHIQSFVDHPFEAVTISRGAFSDDPAIQAIVAEELNIVGERLIDQLVAEGCLRDPTEIAVAGWLAFVRAACLKWIPSQKISRADLDKMSPRIGLRCRCPRPNKPLAALANQKLNAGDRHNLEYLGSRELGSSARCDRRS